MAAVTQEDLDKKRASLDELRAQIAEQEAKAAESVQEKSNVIEMVQLEAEEARLIRQLELAKENARSAAKLNKEDPVLQATLSQLEAAQNETTAPGTVVDTNAEAKSDTPTGEKKKG